MTLVKASLWWRVLAAREHWITVGVTGLLRKGRGARWRNLGGGRGRRRRRRREEEEEEEEKIVMVEGEEG